MCTRWHGGNFRFSRACFRDNGFCQCADALKNLSGIKTALARESLPVPPLQVITPSLAGDLLGEIFVTFSQTSPHMTSYVGASDAPLPRIMIE